MIIKYFRKLICIHRWEKEVIKGGFLVKDGWLSYPVQYRCKKCGQTISEEKWERWYGDGMDKCKR